MTYPFFQPLSSLGTRNRITGAALVASSRAYFGSPLRIYYFLKNTQGVDYAFNFFNNASFGKYRICPGQTNICLR